MDPENDIQELKAEVEELRAVTEDTNRMVHKMRRSIWWGRIWTLLWWGGVFFLSAGAYYYYLQPYVTKIEGYYTSFQHQSSQASSWQQQAQQFFAQYFGASQQSPQVPQSGQ